MKKRFWAAGLICALSVGSLAGCGAASETTDVKAVKLDPNNPVTLTVWHYYNGSQQAAFDRLLEEFNATEGKEQGIYVEGYSQGSVSDLEKAITDSANGVVGAENMPDIFSSYADTAYSVQQTAGLADLSQYFTEEELSEYVDSYMEEGYFNQDGALYLFPVAKSTEIFMMNETDWEPFAEATGCTLEDLSTTEGITEVAQKYYEWTDAQTPDVPDDGKAFYGRDSMANYFVIGMKQMGHDIFSVKDGQVVLDTDKDSLHRLWENYYVPMVKGYFAALGKFRSDDVKTGEVLAYTGSTASAMYFPDNVEDDEKTYSIDCVVAKAPMMENGEHVQVQQGAGMAVTRSDEAHEYASCVFLKWFTQKEQNIRFVCESAYLPVLKESSTVDALDSVIKENNISINARAYDSLKTVLENFEDNTFYTTPAFENGYSARKVLEYNLSDRAKADQAAVQAEVEAGVSREEAAAPYVTEESFENWYEDFCSALSAAAGQAE